ncbi:MAG: hypothetical protein ACLRZ6_11045 [Lachnospiraceae bacterium]
MSEIESAAGRKSGGSGSNRGVMRGLACSIKRRIADTETFDAEVMPDKKLDKKFAVVLTMLKYPFLYKNITIHKNIRTQHCWIISKNHIFLKSQITV